MLLVDTSVWVEVFRRQSRIDLPSRLDVEEIVTCPPVVQEVLQGFQDERAFRLARDAMLAFPIVEEPMAMEVFVEAAVLYRTARRTGLTIRSGVDCLVAACGLRHGLTVLHLDRDFDLLARVSPLEVTRPTL